MSNACSSMVQGTTILCIAGISGILFYTNPTLAAVALFASAVSGSRRVWHTLTAHRRYRKQRGLPAHERALMDDLQGIRQIKATVGRITRTRAADMPAAPETSAFCAPGQLQSSHEFLCRARHRVGRWRQGDGRHHDTGELVGFLFYLMLFYEPAARLHGRIRSSAGRRRTRVRYSRP